MGIGPGTKINIVFFNFISVLGLPNNYILIVWHTVGFGGVVLLLV
jgi:hypothetical protein